MQIKDDLWETEAEAILHQFDWQKFIASPSMWQLERVQDFKIPVKPVFPENAADPRSTVYGYNRDGSLDLNGGPKKSYEKGFKRYKVRYHGALEGKFPTGDPLDPVFTQSLSFLTPKAVENVYNHNIPYYVQRGYDIQGEDRSKKFKGQYIHNLSSGQNYPFFALRLIWKDNNSKRSKNSNSDIPSFVDLHASNNPFNGEYFVLDTYKRNPAKHKNGHGYPTRIPVTTDYCRFQKLFDRQPIAFYDKECHVFTIHVPQTDSAEHFLTRRVINIGYPNIDVDFIEHLAGFDGSFKVFGRDKCGQLVPSSPKHAEMLAQVSQSVNIRSRIVNNPDNGGEPVFSEASNPINEAVLDPSIINYTGIVAGSLNGESRAYDSYTITVPILNAYVNFLDPVNIENEGDPRLAQGTRRTTKNVDRYSSLTSTTLFDFALWNAACLRLPLDVLNGITSFPENVSTTEVPTNVAGKDAYVLVNAHEFFHQSEATSGTIFYLPAEAMSVGIELDPHASNGIFSGFRSGAFAQRLIRTTRGEFTAMRPDTFGLSTYGMGIWWKYLQDQFDFNNQVMRRTLDVLSTDTLGPLLAENNFPDSFAAAPVNDLGGSAALDRALKDLFNKNLKDVWNDYSISITLLRNNTSIPKQWRHNYPYWIYDTEYAGYQKLVDAAALFNVAQFSNWWENMDDNAIIPANYRTPYTGETFTRTLPDYFETDALSLRTFAFNVTKPSEGGPAEINVNVTQGEWRVTLVQFTSDGTREGSFIADGPHTLIAGGTDTLTFDVANHNPSFSETGNIRLICVNVTFDATGKQLEDYFTPEAPSGHIIIESL